MSRILEGFDLTGKDQRLILSFVHDEDIGTLLLIGNYGTGKTTLAERMAQEDDQIMYCDYEYYSSAPTGIKLVVCSTVDVPITGVYARIYLTKNQLHNTPQSVL